MGRSTALRQQHQDLVAIVKALSPKLTPATARAEADDIRRQLSSLAGKLSIHLAMEDKSLYPAMLSSKDAQATAMAREFMDEMGGLAGAFKNYMAQWPHAAAIQAKPAEFCTATQGIFAALAKRIEREERTLYPLADRI